MKDMAVSGSRMWLYLSLIVIGTLVFAAPARADLVVDITSVTANAGTVGNLLEVSLSNTGTSSASVGGFNFEITTSSANINFTGATTSTVDPYIFGGNSLFGPILSTSTGQILDASDLFAVIGGGESVAAGSTVGLGEVSFDVASGTASEIYQVSFGAYPATSFSDPFGNDLAFSSSPGNITVAGVTAVPEPSTALLLSTGVISALGWSMRFKRKDHIRAKQRTR